MIAQRTTNDLSEPAVNIEAEQAVLGAIFLNNETVGRIDIAPEDFSEPLHRRVFIEAQRLHAAGGTISPVTLKDTFPEVEIVHGMTLSQYLARIAAEAVTVEGIEFYVKRLKDLASIRAVAKATRNLTEAKAHTVPPDEALAEFRDAVDTIFAARNSGAADVVSVGDATKETVEEFTAKMQGKRVREGIPSGLADLDNILRGFKHGDLVILAGRPGSGKSTLAASVGRQIAIQRDNDGRHKFGVALFTLEMPLEHMALRLLADHACTTKFAATYNDIIEARFENPQNAHLCDAQADLRATPMLLDYSSRLSVADIAGRVRGMRAKLRRSFGVGLDVVIVDYLKFVKATDRYRGQRVLEVGEISEGLKAIAKDEKLCMILLAQLNRDVEKRENKRPQLSDLRASGELEEDADMVLMTYREAYYLQNHPKLGQTDAEALVIQDRLAKCLNTMEVSVAKNRMGPVGSVALWCNMGTASVRNAARSQHQPAQAQLGYDGQIDPGWQPERGR